MIISLNILNNSTRRFVRKKRRADENASWTSGEQFEADPAADKGRTIPGCREGCPTVKHLLKDDPRGQSRTQPERKQKDRGSRDFEKVIEI